MVELLLRQEDGTYIVVPLKVEIHGTGIVSYPNSEQESDDGESL